MKRSLSAPCLADEDESKRIKSSEGRTGPTSREYLQLALAKVLELQRQIKDDTYVTDNTSDLGESDSEEDVMKEVLTKVFKDLPGSVPTVSSIINRIIQPQPRQLDAIRSKRIQLAGYDTCRRVAIDFMKGVVKKTPEAEEEPEEFHLGTYSRAETKMAGHKTGLLQTGKNGENSKTEGLGSSKSHSVANDLRRSSQNNSKASTIPSQLLLAGNIQRLSKENGNNYSLSNQVLQCQIQSVLHLPQNAANRNVNHNSQNVPNNSVNIRNQAIHSYNRNLQNFTEAIQKRNVSPDYEIRVRMLRGLDLHLAAKQRDFTARLMRQ